MANENNPSPSPVGGESEEVGEADLPKNEKLDSPQGASPKGDGSVKSVRLGQLDASGDEQQDHSAEARPQSEGNSEPPPILSETAPSGETANLNMVLDISVPISVVLGRTTMLVKDVLSVSTGAVIELDRLAGEPVDFLVRDKILAKGEVVVVDDNFGIRITQIASPSARVRSLG